MANVNTSPTWNAKEDSVEETNILVMLVGLPRSGKSTYAKQSGYPIVNPDSIRLALHGFTYRPEAEPMVWAIARYMVRSLFLAGNKVVVLDATNITKKRRDEWKSPEWKIYFKEFTATPSQCIERAHQSNRPDLIPVIERMVAERELLTAEERETIYQLWASDIR